MFGGGALWSCLLRLSCNVMRASVLLALTLNMLWGVFVAYMWSVWTCRFGHRFSTSCFSSMMHQFQRNRYIWDHELRRSRFFRSLESHLLFWFRFYCWCQRLVWWLSLNRSLFNVWTIIGRNLSGQVVAAGMRRNIKAFGLVTVMSDVVAVLATFICLHT